MLYHILPPIYSPWYIENLLATPIVILVLYLIFALCFCYLFTAKAIVVWGGINLLSIVTIVLLFQNSSFNGNCDKSVEIFQFNNAYNEKNVDELTRFLANNNYDLVALQEVTPFVRSTLLRKLKQHYPHVISGISHTSYVNTGQLVLSKYPLDNVKYQNNNSSSYVIQSQWLVHNTEVKLFTVHPPSPRNYLLWKKRNTALYKLSKDIEHTLEENIIMVGDFNLSSFSPRFRIFEQVFSTKPIGSWPNVALLPPKLSIAIDHLFVSNQIEICHRTIREELSYSDHYAIEAHLML